MAAWICAEDAVPEVPVPVTAGAAVDAAGAAEDVEAGVVLAAAEVELVEAAGVVAGVAAGATAGVEAGWLKVVTLSFSNACYPESFVWPVWSAVMLVPRVDKEP